MTALLAVLELGDLAIIAAIVTIFGGGAAFAARQQVDLRRVERQLKSVDQKLDALLKNLGVALPPPPASNLSSEVQQLARDPRQKIAAIRLHREQHPGLGLKEAKDEVEEFYESTR